MKRFFLLKKNFGESRIKIFLMLSWLMLLSAWATAQVNKVRVTGTIVSAEDGELLIGAMVKEKDSNNGVITDDNGKYVIDVSKNAILLISYTGFKPKEVVVNSRKIIDVSLTTDISIMDEVVVVGYGSVKRSDLTGSVVSIQEKDMTAGANISLEQLIQGRAAGVSIQSKSGEPGGAISVKIRGASSINAGNEPLYVIDGMPFDTTTPITGSGQGFTNNPNPRNALNALNPNDIESIEILKDASATAIYGSRGANGVVLVTTKKGKEQKLAVNYDFKSSFQEIAREQEMLDAFQYREVLNNILDEGGFAGEEKVAEFPGNGIYWPDLIYRNGAIQEHNLSFQRGNGVTDYFISFNYFNQDGVLINSGLERYNAKVNLNSSEKGKYAIGLNFNTNFTKDEFVSSGIGINDNGGALYTALNYDPTIPRVIDPFTGRYTLSQNIVMDNPVALAKGQQATGITNRSYGSVFGEYYILPELSAKAKFGANVTNSRRDVWVDPITLDAQPFGGIATIINSTRSNILGEFTLNYNKDFNEFHKVNAVVGTTYEEFNQFNNDLRGSGFLYPDLRYNSIGSGVDSLEYVGSGRSQYKLLSYLGRINYSLKNKYLFTISGRIDGSSRFGPNNRYGFFPSAAIAWKVSEEKFWPSTEVVSDVKLRGSFGRIGNQSIGNYRYITSFSIPAGRPSDLGSGPRPIIEPTRSANPDLRWESSEQTDVGIDFRLFQGRFQGTLEYYVRNTRDLLLDVPQPVSNGFIFRMENAGGVRNQGIEAAISGFLIDGKKFKWNINANFSTLKNEVISLGPAGSFFAGSFGFVNNSTIIKVGEPLYSYYGHVIDGVWQEDDDFSSTLQNVSPGDWKYRDLNDDGIINAEDRQILGDPFPDYSWGLINDFNYKNFNLSLFIEAQHGLSLFNYNLADSYFPFDFRRNRIAEPYLNRWTPENPTNEYASFVNPDVQGRNLVNSRTVEDASFIRLQSVRLSYNLPMQKLGVKFLRNASLYVVGQNLFTITNYSGVDPATNSFGNDLIRMDINSYPFARTYTMGFNIGF